MSKWLIIVYGDVDPTVYGQYKSDEHRNKHAASFREIDPNLKNGIYKLDVNNGVPTMESYSGGFFEEFAK